MFGTLVANTALLEPEQLRRYKASYCGLCHSLKERHGQFSRLALSYDMSFLVLLLGSLYEPEERAGENRCPAHPVHPRPWWRSVFSDYAADMTVALAYLKCLDDWQDDSNPAALAEAKALERAYRRVCTQYPRQCQAMEEGIRALHSVERQRPEQPDQAAACFAGLMGELFVFYEDEHWNGALYRLGAALGRFLYIMDACLDLESDALLNRYNPFRRYYGLDNAERFREILRMLLADCVSALDSLPLVQDLGLLQNILCAGVWAGFDKQYGQYGSKEGSEHGSGSL